jgi:hypothetical protein
MVKYKHNIGICGMCEKNKVIINHYNVCLECYSNIPEYIPISQDKQYIKTFISKRKKKL